MTEQTIISHVGIAKDDAAAPVPCRVNTQRRIIPINFGVVKEMVMTWILTFPGCGLLAFLVTKLFLLIFN